MKQKKVNCEYSFATILQRYFKAFNNINDEYIRERVADVRDVGRRLLSNLYHEPGQVKKMKQSGIIVSHDLSPSDTATMNKEKVLGFVTEIGGPTSHTAILGRALEIPAIVGMDHVTSKIKTGDRLVIDGTKGILIVDPDEETISEYIKKEARFTEQISQLDGLRDLPAETKDGHRVILAANIEFHEEIPSVLSHGAEGIGLYRTEYFYMNRTDLPTEEEQYQAYRQVVEQMSAYPAIMAPTSIFSSYFFPSFLSS